MKITKKQLNHIVNQYKDRYINFEKQKESYSYIVVNNYLAWLFEQWESGLISLDEYRKLINIDILTA